MHNVGAVILAGVLHNADVHKRLRNAPVAAVVNFKNFLFDVDLLYMNYDYLINRGGQKSEV